MTEAPEKPWVGTGRRNERMSVERRFWQKVGKGEDCWEWRGSRDNAGYGNFHVSHERHSVKAHRFAWELANGEVPKAEGYHGMCVLHCCDNPSCVRPDHLFLGTQADNIADRHAKGRTKATSPVINRPGEAHPRAKLRFKQIEELRKLKEDGWLHRELAKHFGISTSYVSRLVNLRFRIHN